MKFNNQNNQYRQVYFINLSMTFGTLSLSSRSFKFLTSDALTIEFDNLYQIFAFLLKYKCQRVSTLNCSVLISVRFPRV